MNALLDQSALALESPAGLLIAAALAAPWLTLLLLCVPARRRLALALAPLAPLPALVAALVLPAEPVALRLGLGSFGLDGLGRSFLLFTALLWSLGSWYARGWLGEHHERSRFTAFLLVAMGGNLGLILAQDLLSFYLFFALLGFSAYGLVVHDGSPAARHAGRIYIAMTVVGEACLFTALALLMVHLPSLDFATLATAQPPAAALALLAIAFGIKLGLLGLHVWLPLAHPVAPVPASAILSGAVIKAGLLGWLRIMPAIEASAWAPAVIALGLTGTFYGVLRGLLSERPKTALAYSSVSQMGLATALVGLGLSVPEVRPVAIAAAAFFALHHALAKGALFLGVGLLGTVAGRGRTLAWLGLILPALVLAGAPGTSGALAKLALDDTARLAGYYASLGPLLYASGAATTLLMARFLYLMRTHRSGAAPARLTPLWLASWALVLGALSLPWWPAAERTAGLSATVTWAALWPVLLGAAIALGLLARPLPRKRLPELGISRLWRSVPAALARLERPLHHWSMVGKLLLLLLVAFLAGRALG